MAKSNQLENLAKSPLNIFAIFSLILGAVTLVRPNPQVSVAIGSLLILFSMWWLIYKCELKWIRTRWWVKIIGFCLSFIAVGFLTFSSWPRKVHEIVLKIDPVRLPVAWGQGSIRSIDVMGRFPSYLGEGFRSADKLPGFWPEKDMEHSPEAQRYTISNYGNSMIYNLRLDFKIVHQETVQTGSSFASGKEVYESASPIVIRELIPYGLTPKDKDFVFYVRNLSEDFIGIEVPEVATLDGKRKIKIRKLGTSLPLTPPTIMEKSESASRTSVVVANSFTCC